MRTKPILITLILAVAVYSATTVRADDNVYDPLEPANRGVFWFNQKFDDYLLKPVSDGYRWLMPKRARRSVSNFFSNVAFPQYFVSDIAQGKLKQSGVDTARFLINSTIGLAGLFDVASEWGLQKQEEDFGQALGFNGVGPGPYLVLPILGPSNLRDTAGLCVDFVLNPFYFLPALDVVDRHDFAPYALGARALEGVNTRAGLDDAIDTAKESAVDLYLFEQGAYSQHRTGKIWDDNPPDPADGPTNLMPREAYEKSTGIGKYRPEMLPPGAME